MTIVSNRFIVMKEKVLPAKEFSSVIAGFFPV